MKNGYTLKEIANWQLKQNCEVTLPSIQRGFVWKPSQVENLWDSILRGYPIGSFLLSENEDGSHDLMDGQQRATAIFLGSFNPFTQRDEANAWSIKGELPVVWLDICPNNKPSTSEYLIRVVTRAHPWGYRAEDNTNKLSQADRRNALALFRKHPDNATNGYTCFENTTVFPYDTCMPLPLSFFFDSGSCSEIIQKIQDHLPGYFKTKHGAFQDKAEFLAKIEAQRTRVDDLLGNISPLSHSVRIHCNTIKKSVLLKENKEDPTLFVRINYEGTKLSGDDLIYSVYKSIFPSAKELVENSRDVLSFIAPTQIIALAARIAWSETHDNVYTQKMGVKEFQTRISEHAFREMLDALISETETVFKPAIDILRSSALSDGGLPPVLIKQVVKSHDLFYAFVFWLRQHTHHPIDDRLRLRMIAKLLVFFWFGTDGKRLVRNNWAKFSSDSFWDEPLHGFPVAIYPPNALDLDNSAENPQLQTWLNVVKWQRGLVLFAQRAFIKEAFPDFNQLENLDDTNTPWDWDHIYPNSWVYKKQCPKIVKNWENVSGNFRAISIEQNRSESDHASPETRLKDVQQRENAFVLDSDWQYWQRISGRTNDAQLIVTAIKTRTKNIYQKIWDDLKLADFFSPIPFDHPIIGTWKYTYNDKGYTRAFSTDNVCELRQDGQVLWRENYFACDDKIIVDGGLVHVINSDGTLSIEGRFIAQKTTTEQQPWPYRT